MDWKRGKDRLAIERATSVDRNYDVLIVSSSLAWQELPIEFKEQVSVSDGVACARLQQTVNDWAAKNGFERGLTPRSS